MNSKPKAAIRRKPVRRENIGITIRVTPDLRKHLRAIPKQVGEAIDKALRGVVSQSAPLPASKTFTGPRYINLDAKGKPTTGEYVAVRDALTGLEWSAGIIGEADFDGANKLATECRLMGKSDWRMPTVDEVLAIIDRSRVDPATDPTFKPPYGWTRTSTPYAGNASGYAWYVNLHDGGCGWFGRSGRGPVRAVRAGQQLGLLA